MSVACKPPSVYGGLLAEPEQTKSPSHDTGFWKLTCITAALCARLEVRCVSCIS